VVLGRRKFTPNNQVNRSRTRRWVRSSRLNRPLVDERPLHHVRSNVARHLKVEPEAALKLTNRKFRKRFRYIEQRLKETERTMDSATLEEMEELWQEAKKQ
jgi:uncharacterized protein YabN with tetrapyrrole methylase and pyrophosphatase domain